MNKQLNYQCNIHGKNCPDVAVRWVKSKLDTDSLPFTHEYSVLLIAPNAEYQCNYCPWCGTKTPIYLVEEL